MKPFNLTEWALHRKQLIYFFVVVIFLVGIISYQKLGRAEFPDFTIRQMVVTISWPGATAQQMEEQVTDKIEKRIQDTPSLDYVKSYSRPGVSMIYVSLKETVKMQDVRSTWFEVRNMVNDIKGTFPQGVNDPTFNDRFDDVFGCVYALTSDGYTYEETRDKAENIRRSLQGVESVKKIQLIGVQPEKIFIEMESSKMAQLGIDPSMITNTIKTQNAMAPSGMVETSSDNIYLRITGMFEDVDSIRNLPIRANNHTFRLGDIARIERSYTDPAEPKMYFNGQPTIGIAISMENGGNVLMMGSKLNKKIEEIKKDLPLGFEINPVADQPTVVEESISEFTKSLAEAVIIVLIISFISLGVRAGIVVTLCIPLVIAGVFAGMNLLGIALHKISLGALIISLGLLVDDAIIAIEMMTVKMEQGWDRFRAACFAYEATAFPMLTGTLITCAGFIPIGFSKGTTSEFTGSIFPVIGIALLISWFVSVMVAPLLGYVLIKVNPAADAQNHPDIYDTEFYRKFKRTLIWCLTHRKIVLSATAVCFISAIFLLGIVKKEFFPSTPRHELIVEMTLPEGSTIGETERTANKFTQYLEGDPGIKRYTSYIGSSAPRFVLTLDPVLPASNYAQIIIEAKDIKTRNELDKKVNTLLAQNFDNVLGHVKLIQNGPPNPYPVMLRVTGYDHQKVREIATQVRDTMANNPKLHSVNMDWNEKSKIMHLEINQDKMRLLGVDSQQLSLGLQAQLSGSVLTDFRERDKTPGILFRIDPQNRKDLSHIKDMTVHIGNGRFVPLDQIAKITYNAENGLIWRRDLKPTITVQAEVVAGVTGNDAAKQVYDELSGMRSNLPPGYSIDLGGPAEKSAISAGYLMESVPLMIITMIVLMMLQLQNIPKMLLTLCTAPLGIIGVSLSLLITNSAMGFVAQLGVLALSGIIIRNSIILIDQIVQHNKAGESTWDAIIDSTVLRFRPIILTALAAILGMIPLMLDVFWGPMAVAIGGGLFVATALTLLVLPTMYAAWYKVDYERKKL